MLLRHQLLSSKSKWYFVISYHDKIINVNVMNLEYNNIFQISQQKIIIFSLFIILFLREVSSFFAFHLVKHI